MPISQQQIANAVAVQRQAATTNATRYRLVAGPGTGKSSVIEMRVAHLLNGGIQPTNICVLSFTRATCIELLDRIVRHCANQPCAAAAANVRVSTIHALALRILRQTNALHGAFPSDPVILDDWEQKKIYDQELAHSLQRPPTRAAEVRRAYDTQWQTLNPTLLAQQAITQAEQNSFQAFHATRHVLYSCVLPGEVIHECVSRIQQGAIQLTQLPHIQHLIVDEFQDLNACDQEFVRLLATANNCSLFVAGDDDQSIYSFRHADPSGLVSFPQTYPGSTTGVLNDCFRCTPAVLQPALNLVGRNPGRVAKNLQSLYAGSVPPVQGTLEVWSFATAQDEARAIAESCRELIQAGMAGQEDEIVVLIANRRLQLDMLAREFSNLGVRIIGADRTPLTDEDATRAVYCMLRILHDVQNNEPDYVAYRGLLQLLDTVGTATAMSIADVCIQRNYNFRGIFHSPVVMQGFNARGAAAVSRVMAVVQGLATWTLQDTLAMRGPAISNLLSTLVFTTVSTQAAHLAVWNGYLAALDPQMTLQELLDLVSATSEADQIAILDAVSQRVGTAAPTAAAAQKGVRILTMHGAKGLSGKVVFIPSLENTVMPNSKALQAAGLLIEQRRLLYVALTRARAACILSHATLHTGPQAFMIANAPTARLPRSQFIGEMGLTSLNRTAGLTQAEAARIVADIRNL